MALAQPVIDQPIEWEIGEKQVGLWSDAWQRFRRNRLALVGAVLVLFLVIVALAAPLLVQLGIIQPPNKQHVEFIESGIGQNGYLFGSDELGRDTLSRLMFGSQVSLSVGILVQFIILPIGLAIGLLAGYFGGRIDNVLMRFTDIWYAFPDLLFVLVVVSVFQQYTSGVVFLELLMIFGAIALVNWVGLARLVRGQHIRNLRTDGHNRVQSIHRALKDNRKLAPAKCLQLRGTQRQDIDTAASILSDLVQYLFF